MLLKTLSSWVFLEKRRLIEVFPEPVQKLWNTWELRVMVLISLTLQISLIHFGSRRKCNVKAKIRVFLWFAYLMADWVATVALGVLSQNQGNRSNKNNNDSPAFWAVDDELSAFWAPFLLLHLGGPDTITAYALEDNELWLRHLLGLSVQVGVSLYIFLMAWNSSWLSILTIPMLLSGLIKYGERTLALRSANREKFRDSMLTRPDPGPNYAKFMDELALKKAEGYEVWVDEGDEADVPEVPSSKVDRKISPADVNIVLKANELFQIFKRLFVDLILSFQDRDSSQLFFQSLDPVKAHETAFNIVEVELGYAYDVFHTKAPLIYTPWGCFFRTITFCSTCLVFVFFLINEMHKHLRIDLIITYILLVGAIILEIYALLLVISSDWTTLWLSRHGKSPFSQVIRRLRQSNKQRWSNSMAQFNFLGFCLKIKPEIDHGNQKLFCMQKVLEMQWYKFLKQISAYLKEWLFTHILGKFDEKLKMSLYLNRERISDELKNLIFDHLLGKSHKTENLTNLCASRGNLVLEDHNFPNFTDWTTGVEFDQSILLWHIATDLCDDQSDDPENMDRKVSKHIANYMMYLLVMCPFMLPIGIGLIRFQDTCAEAVEFFEGRNLMSSAKTSEAREMLLRGAREMLLRVSTEVKPAKVKGDRSKSVLFDACILASSLNKQQEKKWEILRQVWIEILAYAASHCQGNFHALQLRRGGEFLTHVWLLMAHLGITEQLQISQGHARVKLMAW